MTQLKDKVKTWRKPARRSKRDRAPRGSDETALRAAKRKLLLEAEESEAQKAMALAELQARIDAEDAANAAIAAQSASRKPLLAAREAQQFHAHIVEEEATPSAPVASIPLGYTNKGPLRANSDYADKSDLELAAQLIRDLDLEPHAPRGQRVIRASPSPFKRRR